MACPVCGSKNFNNVRRYIQNAELLEGAARLQSGQILHIQVNDSIDEGICAQVPNFNKHRSDLKRGNAAAEEEKLASARNAIENRLST